MRVLRRTAFRVLLLAAIIFTALPMTEKQPAYAAAPVLTNAQRQAYLYYYAPVIFKRANEDNGQDGRDWLTNFDFDQDHNFATNRSHWLDSEYYVAASAARATGSPYAQWRIRPTLYTSLIEYTAGTSKSLVLLYHVYNAQDKEGEQIHDWERIELVVRNVTGTPGGIGEYVNNSTITHHGEHIIRKRGDFGFNFMNTATGSHLMIWQADETKSFLGTGPHAHELRYVNDTYASLASQPVTDNAEVEISGEDSNKNVHYIFVPQASSAAINAWGAQPLTFANAYTLIGGHDNDHTVDWYQAKRITYELQDIADITATNWSGNPAWSTHWLSGIVDDIELESPLVNEAGVTEVPAGRQRFYTQSRDIVSSSSDNDRTAVVHKGWFYGVYSAEADEDWPPTSDDFPGKAGTGTDSYGWTRQMASGRYDSPNSYWWQHDLFVHDGTVNSSSSTENGQWLGGAWYTAANGGFDGRWVQIFDDRPGLEASTGGTETLGCSFNGATWTANSCLGWGDSLIQFSPSSLSGAYSYQWTITNQSGSVISNICDGSSLLCIYSGCTTASSTCTLKVDTWPYDKTYTASLGLTQSGVSKTITATARVKAEPVCCGNL